MANSKMTIEEFVKKHGKKENGSTGSAMDEFEKKHRARINSGNTRTTLKPVNGMKTSSTLSGGGNKTTKSFTDSYISSAITTVGKKASDFLKQKDLGISSSELPRLFEIRKKYDDLYKGVGNIPINDIENSIVIEENGKYVVIPNEISGEDLSHIGVELNEYGMANVSPRIVTDEEAIKVFNKTSKNFGVFDTKEEADNYVNLAKEELNLYKNYVKNPNATPVPLVVEIDGETQSFGYISLTAYDAWERGTLLTSYEPKNSTERLAIEKLKAEVEAYNKKMREPEDPFQGILHGVGYTLENIGAGAIDIIETIGQFAEGAVAWGGGKFAGLLGDEETAKSWDEYAASRFSDETLGGEWAASAEERYRVPDEYREYGGPTARAVGELIPALVAEYFTAGAAPGFETMAANWGGKAAVGGLTAKAASTLPKLSKLKLSDTVFTLGAMGNYTKYGLEKTGDTDQALAYGVPMGMVEMFTEKLFGGYAGTGIGADEIIDVGKIPGISKIANNKVGKVALDIGLEGAEEAIVSTIDPAIQRATIDPNATWSAQEIGADALQGMLLSSVMKSSTSTINKGATAIQKRRAVKSLNADIETINTLFENEADKFVPLRTNASVDEIVERQNQIKDFYEGYTEIVAKSVVATNPEILNTPYIADAINRVTSGVAVADSKPSSTPLSTRLNALSQGNETISIEDVKKASGFGENGAKLLTELASQDGMTFPKARDAMMVAYMAGYNGEKINFSNDMQNTAMRAGIDDKIIDNQIALENAKNATVYDGAFTDNEYTQNWSDSTKKMVSRIAKDFGMSIKGVDKIIANTVTGAEANASHIDGKMQISSNKSVEKLIHALIMHESGHRMEQFATKEWNALASVLYERAERLGRRAKLGVSKGMAFDRMKAAHDEAGITKSTSGYYGEVVMEELETIFRSEEEFNKFIDEIKSNKEAKSALRKVIDFITELIKKVKKFIAELKMSDAEYIAAIDTLAELEHIKELYAKAYLATEKAVAEKRADTKTTKNLEIKTNQEYNGNINHSLKWHTDLSRTQIKQVEKWLRQVSNHKEKSITDTASWYKGRIDGEDLFVIYSTMYNNPTILYEVSGENASAELDILLRAMEVMESERSVVEKSRIVDELLNGDWVQEKHNMANNNVRPRGRGSNIGYASVLQGKSSKFIGSKAFRNVVRNIYDIQERSLNEGEKSFSLKDSDYLKAVESGDMETAQRMVDEKGKNWGAYSDDDVKPITFYHGTLAKPFTKFNKEFIGSRFSYDEVGFFFIDRKSLADDYAHSEFNKDARGTIIPAFLKITKPLVVDKNFAVKNGLGNIFRDNDAIGAWDIYQSYFLEEAESIKADGILVKDGMSTMAVVFEPNQIKSAEAVTYDDNDKVIPLSERFNKQSNDIRYSLKDSEGKTLTKAQQEYFKDSKVVDENGNLLVMYQGSANDFTVFDRKKSKYSNLYGRGFYFTKSERHASQYGNTRAYYLDIKHPVSTTETTITKPQLRKFLEAVVDNEDYSFENYGYDATIDSVLQSTYGKSDFLMLNDISQTAIGDLVEAVELFNEINGTDYDGIILDTETVIFNSEQAKLTTNKNPTSNPDINFSLKKPVEETKNLIAVHNTTADKLLGALKLGGLPAPSIAITKKDMSHEKFGDISMIFRKDSISPTDRRNKIYSGDAYTPTGVRVEYDIDDDILQEFNKKLKDLTPEWANERLPSVDSGTANAENDSLYNAYERNDRAKLAFLREKGKAPKVAMRTPRLSNFVSNDTVIALAKAFSAKQLSEIANTSEGLKQYKNAFLKVIRDTEDSRVVEHGIYSAEAVHNFDIEETARKAAQVKENKYKIKKEVDTRAINELIDKKFTKALKAEYRAWIDENTKDAIVDKGIRNNRDLFTPSGSRRSFKQLHDPYNLSNIIKQMFSGEDKGIALFGGSPIGAAQHEYSSIADVKADSGRIQQLEQEEYDKIRDQIEADVLELAQKMKIRSDVFAIRNLLSEAIGKKTKQQADAYLKRESQGWANYSPEFTNELWDIKGRILNMPTGYFEAKPQRAVGFNEVVLAVLPKGMTELRKKLEDAGVQKVVYYDKTKDGDRHKKVNSVPDVNFSLKNTNHTDTKERKELLDIIEHLKGEFEVTKFAKADPKKLAKLTKDILKEYSSKADYDETRSAIDELYTYMANGEDGNTAVWDEVYNRAYNIAQNIVENSLVVDDEMYQHYKSLRDYLRGTPMKFDARYDDVPSSYENFNEFRKLNTGRLKFTKDGRGIGSVYLELAGLYPEFFNEEEQTNASDQLERIIEVLDELQPTQINPFDRQISQVSMQLANDLTSRFFDLPQAKPTFADKAERRVVDAHIKGAKKVEAVRQQNKERIKKLIESQKAKTKKQLDKIRDDRDTKVKKEKEKRREALAKKSEKQKAKELRAKITRHAGELKKTLLKATDKKHIPAELENAVLALLYNINMESNYTYDVETNSYKKNDKGVPTNKTKAFLALKEVYADIATNNDYGLTLASELFDKTGDGVANIFDEVMKLSDKKIADMTSEELTKIYDAIRLVEHSIATANKMFAMQRWEDLTKTAKAFELSVATRRVKHSLMNKRLILDIETPLTFFSNFGVAGEELYQALREAQDNEQKMVDELAEHIHGIVSLEQVKKAEKTYYKFTTAKGKKLTLSKAHIMDIYLLSKRKQGLNHLLHDPDSKHFGNGIHQPEIKGKLIKRDSESTRLTKSDLSNIISKLDASDKAIADKMQKATLLLAEWGNKACMEVFGYEKFNDPDYWTVKSARESLQQTMENNKNRERSIKNMGSAKNVNDEATNAVDVYGLFALFNQHASDMICYSAWLGIMEDATKLLNYTFRETDGTMSNRTFKSMLEKYGGAGGEQYYFNLLKDIQNGISAPPDTATEGIYTRLYGMAAKAAVAFKATVVAQQPMSIVRATTTINPLSILQATVKGGVNLPVWAVSKVKNIVPGQSGQLLSEWYGGWQKALKYSPIASRKAIGGYEINSNSSGLKGVLYNPDTTKGKAVDFLKESPLWAAGKADELTWGLLWNACEIETRRKNKVLEKGSEAYYEAVNELFTKVINETQVVDGVLQRSQLMRSSSGWIKPATSFTGEPTQALNAVIRAYDTLRYEKNPTKRGKKIRAFGRATTVFLVSAVFTAFARSLAVGLTGEDDDEYWNKVWKSFSGIQGDEETWFDYVKSIGLKSDAVNNINPFTWLPITREIMSSVQRYDVERLDVASIANFIKEGAKFIESLDGEGKYTIGYSLRNFLLKTAEFTGYSPYNLIKDLEGAIRTTKRETEDYKGLYEMEKKRTKPANNTSAYIDILYKAYSADSEDYEYIYDDLVKEIKEGLLEKGIELTEDDKKDGKTVEMVAQEKAEETIESGMETRMKKAEGVEKTTELTKRYMPPEHENTYDSSLNRVKSSEVWKSANAEQRKIAEAKLYNFLTSTSESMEMARADARAFGVDETEYTLLQLAMEMVDDKNNNNNSLDAKEKAEVVGMLDLGNSELAYFYGTKGSDEAYAHGLSIENYAMFKAAVSGLKGDNKKSLVIKYANQYADSEKEYLFFMGTEYSSYKKRSDYKRYFSK